MAEVEIKVWTINEIHSYNTRGLLDYSPSYQRSYVWKPRNKVLLIDSIVRKLPIGAITVLEQKQPEGFSRWEVIDGKQRISTILEFIASKFPLSRSLVVTEIEKDDDEPAGEPIEASFWNKKWDDLSTSEREVISQYRLPVVCILGSPVEAVRTFYRMNKFTYGLTSQEIRNAVFANSEVVSTVKRISDQLNREFGKNVNALSAIGVVSEDKANRMYDLQLLSELLLLLIDGPQHRRDTLDEFYHQYRDKSAELEKHEKRLVRIFSRIFQTFERKPLKEFHFPSNCEHDLYGLVGALAAFESIPNHQFDARAAQLKDSASEFMRQVTICSDAIKSGGDLSSFLDSVQTYSRLSLRGQINSQERREKRIEIWKSLLDEIFTVPDKQRNFTSIQRQVIWARSEDKRCGRCGDIVDYNEFEAGHVKPWADGGETIVSNGRIEHRRCNRQGGAS
ncbi:MAG: hypothetical protein KatS3mg082_3420 [Nitrospiraceae bacterium]|nr:MAG: hypothetical protein KatS3mg082_3420 [Nitrospiraceae bacterium]